VKRHASILVQKKIKCHHQSHIILLCLFKIPDISDTTDNLAMCAGSSSFSACDLQKVDIRSPLSLTRTSQAVACRPGQQVTCCWHLLDSLA